MNCSIPEPLLTLGEATKRFPQRPARVTLWRWLSVGVGGVRLRSVVCGGRRLIPESAIDEFIANCTAQRDGRTPAPSQSARGKQKQKAIDKLERDGW